MLAATNRYDLLDAALLRPGRFDIHLQLPLPDQKAREKFFQVHLRDRPLDGEVTAQWLAEQTQGFSGAEIEAACHRAMMAAISERIKLTPDSPKTDQHLRRQQSDFLAEVNHEGEILDFHSLRHTCGVWLSMNGAHPKAVQSVMRHSTIVLTMDTYGHLFPGQDAAAVARFPSMLYDEPKVLQATGTTNDLGIATDEGAQHKAQQLERVNMLSETTGCENNTERKGSDPFLSL